MRKEIIANIIDNSDAYHDGENVMMCIGFVTFFLKVAAPPPKIKIILSSDEENGLLKVNLLKLSTVWFQFYNMKKGPLFHDGYDYMFRGLSDRMEDFIGPDNKGVVYVKIEQVN